MANYKTPSPSARRRYAPTKRALMGVKKGRKRVVKRRSRSGKMK